jgi:hypothetical protein
LRDTVKGNASHVLAGLIPERKTDDWTDHEKRRGLASNLTQGNPSIPPEPTG